MNAKLVLGALATVAVLAPVGAATAAAYRTYVERSAASDVPTHIWTFSNCIGRQHYPFSGTAFAEHGTVTFKEAVKNRCGDPNAIAREVWYRSDAGFAGIDIVTFPRGRGHSEILAVKVH
jgi:hypothetical protein